MSDKFFAEELLRDRGRVLQANDGRQSITRPPPGTQPDYEPKGESFVNVYVREELAIADAPPYRGLAPGIYGANGPGPYPWDVTDHGAFADVGGLLVPRFPNYLTDMSAAMNSNPHLRIQQHSGIYDLECSSFPADWALRRIDIRATLRSNIEIFDYASGHAVFNNARQSLRNSQPIWPRSTAERLRPPTQDDYLSALRRARQHWS